MKPVEKKEMCASESGAEEPRPIHWQGHDAIWRWYEYQIGRLRDMIFNPEMFMFGISQGDILDLLGRIEAAPDQMNDHQRYAIGKLREELEGKKERR